MAASVSRLTQSQYFSPVFNTAVFDGPVRIYFAQKHEAYALEIYFKISSRLRSIFGDSLNRKAPNVFVMIHPDQVGFEESFPDSENSSYSVQMLDRDHVIGVNGTLSPEALNHLIDKILDVYREAFSHGPREAFSEI